MRILVVTGTFHPEIGGPPTYLYNLLPELVSRGHQVRVVTYGEPVPSHTYAYPVTRVTRRQSVARRLLAMTREVLRQGRDADLLFVSDYGLPAALANLWLRKPLVIKVVSDFAWEFSVRHGWVPPDTTIDGFQGAQYGKHVGGLRAIQRAYVSAAQRVIVPSRYIQSIVCGWGVPSEKIRVIYNAAQVDAFAELPDRGTLRDELGYEGPTIVCAARLTPWKGCDGLIRALGEVRRVVPDARLWLVGDGIERPHLEAVAQEMGLQGVVRFTGELPRELAARYLKAADVFALFSTYEGLPHVVLEAMAAGTPVVASSAGGTPETVRDGESGLLVPVGDEAALAGALVRALKEPGLAARLVEGGRAEVERFSMQRMVAQTEALLREAASEP